VKKKKKTKFPQGIVESGKNAPGNHHLSKSRTFFFHSEVQQRTVKSSYVTLAYFNPKKYSLSTEATDELLCLKNAGTQISMFFTSE
jgi:hypothetical protein